jgi:RNA polymerase sigma-B factor
MGIDPGLTGDDELLQRFYETRDPEIREELTRRYLPLARSLALRYAGGSEPNDDLMQVASLGLIAAIDRFDPSRGSPFTAFAGPTILGELRRHFRDKVWALRVPRGLQERIRSVDEAIAKLTADLERAPTVRETAALLELNENDVLEALEASDARRTVSLDRPARIGEEGDTTSVSDRVGSEDTGFERVEERVTLRSTMAGLSGVEREVLRLRFVEDLTQSKIAERVGYSQMHVSRILRGALERMREAAPEDGD